MSDGHSLFVWVTPSGGKLFRWAYQFQGKENLMTFGKYPAEPLSLARERLAEGRRQLSIGLDPMAERKALKTADQVSSEIYFSSVTARWLAHWKADKSDRHVDSTERRLNNNVLPSLGSLQMTEIRAPQIVSMVREMEARSASDVAKRALETTGQIFRYAIADGFRGA